MSDDSEKLEKPLYGFKTVDEQEKLRPHLLSYSGLWFGFKDGTTAHGVASIVDAKGNTSWVYRPALAVHFLSRDDEV